MLALYFLGAGTPMLGLQDMTWRNGIQICLAVAQIRSCVCSLNLISVFHIDN